VVVKTGVFSLIVGNDRGCACPAAELLMSVVRKLYHGYVADRNEKKKRASHRIDLAVCIVKWRASKRLLGSNRGTQSSESIVSVLLARHSNCGSWTNSDPIAMGGAGNCTNGHTTGEHALVASVARLLFCRLR